MAVMSDAYRVLKQNKSASYRKGRGCCLL